MPKGRRPNKEIAELRERAMNLSLANPTLSMATIARHYGVSEATVAKWFSQKTK